MGNFSRKTTRFFLRNRDKGIPHLLLGIAVVRLVMLFLSAADRSGALLGAIDFQYDKVLEGQVWRLFSYALLPDSSILWALLSLMFYYFMDQSLEMAMGRLKSNLYILTSILLLDAGIMLLGLAAPLQALGMGGALSGFLDMALILAWAAVNPDAGVMFMMIIPLKLKYLAWLYIGMLVYDMFVLPFPAMLMALLPMVVLLLFLRRDVADLLPDALRYRARKVKRTVTSPKGAKPPRARAVIHEVKRPYHHKCTVCGRTDTDFPDLEFRYCSRCSGYYCYCSDHINNHAHIVDAEPIDKP